MATTEIPDWEQVRKAAEAEKAATDAQKSLLDSQKALAEAQAEPDAAKKALDDKLAAAKAAKEVADAEKAAADARKAALDAQTAADPAQRALDAQAAAIKAAKDKADADKAVADARKATTDAQTAALKAQFGDFNASGITGAVDLKDKAGSTEAALLAALSAKTAAARITRAISRKLPPAGPPRKILLYASAEAPGFQSLLAFRAQFALVSKAFSDAGAISKDATAKAPPLDEAQAPPPPPAPDQGGAREAAIPLAAVGLGLETVNKMLSYFRTDYAVGGIDLNLEDSLLVQAVAGALTDTGEFEVQLPAIYQPSVLTTSGGSIVAALTELARRNADGQRDIAFHEETAAGFNNKAANAKAEADKKALLDKAALHAKAAEALKTALSFYETFFGKLTTADDKGAVPLSNAIREAAVADALAEGAFLLAVKLHKSGGAYYTKKNLWTFLLPGMPLYHMGGVVAGYALLSGAEGKVIAAGVVPIHGGFVKAKDVEARLASDDWG